MGVSTPRRQLSDTAKGTADDTDRSHDSEQSPLDTASSVHVWKESQRKVQEQCHVGLQREEETQDQCGLANSVHDPAEIWGVSPDKKNVERKQWKDHFCLHKEAVSFLLAQTARNSTHNITKFSSLIEKLGREVDEERGIRRVKREQIDQKGFALDFVGASRPCIVSGCSEGWAAVDSWGSAVSVCKIHAPLSRLSGVKNVLGLYLETCRHRPQQRWCKFNLIKVALAGISFPKARRSVFAPCRLEPSARIRAHSAQGSPEGLHKVYTKIHLRVLRLAD